MAQNNNQLTQQVIDNLHIRSSVASLAVDTIYNVDCVDLMAEMPDEFIDLVVTSPPYDELRDYNGNSSINLPGIISGLYRVLKTGGVVVWVISDQTKNGDESGTSFIHALKFKEIGFRLFDTMIYLKPPRGACGNNNSYWQTFEYMFVFSKSKPKTINLLMDRENKDERKGDSGTKRLKDGSLKKLQRGGFKKFGRRTNVWQYHIGNGHSATDTFAKNHPAVFPEKLAQDHIISWSNQNDIVYDPFMGSGTTAKMAILNDRHFIGSEIVQEYCDIANKRIQLATYEKQSRIQGL